MLLCRIDILMTQNICHKVNIAGFLVQGSTISAAELMRCNFLCCCNLSGIFFNQIFNCLDTDPAALGRIEESVFMTCQWSNIFPDFQIFFERFFYLRSKIYNHFISTFSSDFDPVIFEIHIFNIQSDTFGYTDSSTKKESYDRKISVLCFFIIHPFLASQSIPAVLDIIKEQGNFIGIQTDNAFVVDLRYIDQNRWVGGDHFMSVVICIKTTQCRNFTLDATFAVCFGFGRVRRFINF